MGRTEAKAGQAAKRPMAATPGASLPRDVSVLSMVADLEGRDLDGLRRQWRVHLGGEAPAHLPRWLLMRVLAYRLQSDAFGDLDKSGLLSWLATGTFDGRVAGLRDFAPQDQPPLLPLLFYAFRVMAGIGFALFVLMLWTVVAWLRGWLDPPAIDGNREAAEVRESVLEALIEAAYTRDRRTT